MTRTILSIRFVLILATVIGIRGEKAPREATLTITSNFEDGQSDREFKVDYAGFSGTGSPIIKIFKEGESDPRVEYTVTGDVTKARMLYFKLSEKDAPEGLYQVEVCAETCSERRPAVGKVLKEEEKPALICIKGQGKEENVLYRFLDDTHTTEFKGKVIPGNSFMKSDEIEKLPKPVLDLSAYKMLNLDSNPAYKTFKGKKIFYAGVFYNGTHLKDLLDTAVSKEQKDILDAKYQVKRKLFDEEHTHGYCSRKYLFWASAHVMNEGQNVVLRRFRGTILPTEAIVNSYILKENADPIPVEFVREDEEEEKLPVGKYDVAVSFCATDKDTINSSVCSTAIYSKLIVA